MNPGEAAPGAETLSAMLGNWTLSQDQRQFYISFKERLRSPNPDVLGSSISLGVIMMITEGNNYKSK